MAKQPVPLVFGTASSVVKDGVDFDEVLSDCQLYFLEDDGQQATTRRAATTLTDPDDDGTSGEPTRNLDRLSDLTNNSVEDLGLATLGEDEDTGVQGIAAEGASGRTEVSIDVAAAAIQGVKRDLENAGLEGVRSHEHETGRLTGKSMSEQQKLERRERNREHAKRSRIRKKFMLECLQAQLLNIRKQNMALRQVVEENMPDEAAAVFERCNSAKDMFFSGTDTETGSPIQSLVEAKSKKPACFLLDPDFRLMQALIGSQQNIVISDPSLPDNPIVYASQGFLLLTGYAMKDVIGRNCRFLQGSGTDRRTVDIVRRGVAEGRDTSVCIINYKADGTPFWNQFFLAALRDGQGKIVNFVGVQCEVEQEGQQAFRERLRKIPVPEELTDDDSERKRDGTT